MDFFKQETHSSIKNENAWVNDLNCLVFFFSHGAPNSCGALIAYLGEKSFVLNEQKTDKAGRGLMFDITLDADQYILINLYNANTDTEQVKILEKLQSLLKNLDIRQSKGIISSGNMNVFFNSKKDTKSGKLLLKKKSIAKLVEKTSLDISDIWRIRNPNTQNLT